MGTALLITGAPGSGKTTFIRALVATLPWRAGGFFTDEIREGGSASRLSGEHPGRADREFGPRDNSAGATGRSVSSGRGEL